jgi:hypothetical protein
VNRTMGSEVNALTSIHLFGDVRNETEFKSFDARPGYLPQAHGDFNHCPFWRREFWSVATVTRRSGATNVWNCYPEDWQKRDEAADKLTAEEKPAKARSPKDKRDLKAQQQRKR